MNLFEAGSAISRLEGIFDRLEYLIENSDLNDEDKERCEYIHTEALQLIDAQENFDIILDLTDRFNRQWETYVRELNNGI